MKPYLVSLGAGILIGAIYALMNVRSPAPPVIALAGLLGILIGEQAVPLAKRLMRPQTADATTAPVLPAHRPASPIDHVRRGS